MIKAEKRKAIWTLYQEGMGIRKIAQTLHVDRKTVHRIIEQQGEVSLVRRKDRVSVDEELLRKIFKRCNGWSERIHEVLTKEYGIKIGYSTLTAMIRELDLKGKKKDRSGHVPDVPGEEFQHDTSPYTIAIAGKQTKVQASLMYYRFSKVRYLKFYNSFTRFHMQCFFYEALNYFGLVPGTCIIDNTNLAVLRGSGSDAVMVPEMVAFAKQFGFKWKAHAIKHSNRKAGNERGFWTIETNLFPGRDFFSLDDLNRQALMWVEERSVKPTTKQKIIPANAFEYEKSYMNKILTCLPAPYRQHLRVVDQYGYVAFAANYYWVPIGVSGKVTVLEYANKIRFYFLRKEIAEYLLPSSEVKNQRFLLEGVTVTHRPNNRKFASQEEEKRLRSMGESIDKYVTLAIKVQGSFKRKHRFVKGVYSLSKRVAPKIFNEAILRALKYHVYSLETLSNICSLIIQSNSYAQPEPEVDFGFEVRDSYLEGEISDEPDLNEYDEKYSGGRDEES